MLSIPPNVRVYLCTKATDMRRGFDGLHTQALQVFQRDPVDGHLFLFVNRRRDRLKMLWFDRDGMALFYKKLEDQYPHFLLFTEIGEYADNLGRWAVTAV